MATLLLLRNEAAVGVHAAEDGICSRIYAAAVPSIEILRVYTMDVSGTDQYAVLRINDCDNNVCGVMHAHVDNVEVSGCFAA